MINKVRDHPNNIVSKDHLGNIFPTRKAMCEHWGISCAMFVSRLDRGMTIEQALTTGYKLKREIVINNRHYLSATVACKALGLNPTSYNTYRTKYKLSREAIIYKMLLNKERKEEKERKEKKEVLK